MYGPAVEVPSSGLARRPALLTRRGASPTIVPWEASRFILPAESTMRRLGQLVRPRLSQVGLLLALAGQLAGTVGIPVRPRSSPPVKDVPTVAAAPATSCCCSGGNSNGRCCCCCSASEPATPHQDDSETTPWTLALVAGHCQGQGPLLAGSLPPCLPCDLPGTESFHPAPAGWLADDSLAPVRVTLPRITPPPRAMG